MKAIVVLVSLLLSSIAFAQDKKPVFEQQDNGLVKATYFHDNGEVAQIGTFTGNKRHGQWIAYDKQGNKVAQAQYEDDKRIGKWFHWDESVLTEIDYNENQIVAVNKWTTKNEVAVKTP